MDAHSDQQTESAQKPTRIQRWYRRARTALRAALPFIVTAVAAFLALLLYTALTPKAPVLTARDVDQAVDEKLAELTPVPAYSAEVYQIIQPSLVFIQTHDNHDDKDSYGVGTGVIVNAEGAILTSLHVVDGASDITLVFADGTHAKGQVAVAQPENDIAVVVSNKLPEVIVPAVLGNPRSMRIGDEAYAVGNPLGLYSSMSAGVISGFDRTFKPEGSNIELTGMIQIDTAVNPGNSGGPLLNRDGQVIGIVTGLVNPTEQNVFIGIGFAVPIQVAGGAAGMPLQ